jgi:hypothetical protein
VAQPATLAGDPENRWLARQSRCRLEGEAIRDSLLAISGRLNDSQAGPSVLPPIPADLARTARSWSPSANPADHARRSIYIFNRRNLRFPFLEVFDAPDNNQTCPERGRSTTAPQALTLLNASEVMEAAAATARRVAAHSPSPPRQIAFGHRLILGREPTPAEQRMAEEFVRESEHRAAGERAGVSEATHELALTELCRAWFNLSEFVYAE